MRILYHHRTSARDGSAVHIEGLVSGLRQLGAEVLVVAPPIAAPAVGAPAKNRWIQRLRKGLPRFVHELGELAYNFPEAVRLSRAIKRFEPDVIYQRSNLFLVSGAWAAKRAGIPLIEEVNAPFLIERSRHGGIALPSLAAWTERIAWTQADAIVAVTKVLADIVAERGIPPGRLHVMPNGIDEGLLTPDAVALDAKAKLGLDGFTVLGFTGFVRDWNGLDDVIKLLDRPAARNWYLLIVGDGPARESLAALARRVGVADRVRFTGVVGRDRVANYVSAFDIALQPAANPYASPLKLFEYMALGRAIVAPDQPNIREVLRDGQDALLFDQNDAEALGAVICRLAEDVELRNRIACAAMAAVRERNLTWRHNASRVLKLASRLVGAAKGEPHCGAAYADDDASGEGENEQSECKGKVAGVDARAGV